MKGNVVDSNTYWYAENSGFTDGACWFPTVPALRYDSKEEAIKANDRMKAVFPNDTIKYRVVKVENTKTAFHME